ncbi:uncharacterized protein EURHEDRAFT_411581 [Aspergillus ruber CBS 135680]|uniref:Uncharacterized protein n=1 Tax=Aspergillus ruber (strain CBS 135680) TaxID=1388766 RepID=A0A017SGG5_ASPRC|nr:uncharacterized protein EURHEDRAFT_411581 [Aspergillus ruber CBS 135680]EYE95856.1 hypothetical protein EURHEDRAFT_411581 [Aspergillus ruber CBS 135680]
MYDPAQSTTMPIYARSIHSSDSASRDSYWFRLIYAAGLVIVSHESGSRIFVLFVFSFFFLPACKLILMLADQKNRLPWWLTETILVSET